ncbi:MAG TPA: DinB family protein [Gemmatimonadaceae bacterium]|nr:DinB family protein [Gemmatimonadaceae bacterium]
MTTPAIPIKEFDLEMTNTRRLIERIPSDKATWKPHEKSLDKLVAAFDANVRGAHEALASVVGAALDEPWSLKMGEMVLMTMPCGEAARQHLSHLIHHRGELMVYARLVDVPLPKVYGPTADEKW